MVSARAKRSVKIPQEKVWALLADLSTVIDYHPSVKNVDILSSKATGIGATRRCTFFDGTSITEEVIQAGDDHVILKMKDYSAPMKDFTVKCSALRVSDTETEIIYIADYTVKFGPLGYLMNWMMIQSMMRKMFTTVLEGIEYHLTTGQQVLKEKR
jgi:carbon monoxide dehydrogenase subunit G